ncbi:MULTISPECIES: hypothetical protein [Campylobacter]|uniref:hypothetical protein n=1 Tax=Campylobacter TaxID=194 RepID=UPI000A3596ED|nr:hypothetical protein [Campylobacter sp. P0024]MCR8678284.1 hypothetical protein [Campylobacter sp. RM19072]
MAISAVVVKGNFAYVYDERGRQIRVESLGSGSLQGYTSSSYSIKKGAFIYVYNEKGQIINTISA